jgi:hypothetical protein
MEAQGGWEAVVLPGLTGNGGAWAGRVVCQGGLG